MKVKTVPAFYNQTLTVAEESIVFDSTGTCEVENEIGAALIEKYPEFVFSADSVKKKEVTVQEEVNQDMVNRLKNEIQSLEEKNSFLKAEKTTLEADLKVWKDQVEGYVEKVKVAEKAYKDQKESHDGQVQTLELKMSLLVSTNDALRKLCEASGYKKEEWEKLSKEKLIEYILNKA